MRLLAQEAPGTGQSGFDLIPGIAPETQANIVLSVLIIVAVLFARRGVLAIVSRRVEGDGEDEVETRYRWAKTSASVAFVVTMLMLLPLWFAAIRTIGTFLGLLSAGLAIALKDLVADLAGWVFILWRKPFEVGDRVQIGGNAGDVVDRSIFQFTIMEIGNWVDADQSTGRLIHIPNAKVFTEPLANYVVGFPYLWNELKVMVTFESDWRKAKVLLNEIAAEFSVDIKKRVHRQDKREQRFMIRYRKLTPVVYVSVEDSGVLLTLRYLCAPRERRGSASRLWELVLDAFAEHPDVTLAYPTQRVNLAREVLSHPEDTATGSPAEGDEKAGSSEAS